MKWIDQKLEVLNNCGIFTVTKVQRKSALNETGDFVVLDTPDWVNVISRTRDKNGIDCFLMVRQFRHGTGKITCEFPAGAIEKGESPEEAAERELREETGFTAEKYTVIGNVCPNPAFMNNRVYTVIAENIKQTHSQNFDRHEYVEIEYIPAEKAARLMGTNEYDNGVMLMALFFYKRYLEMQ